MKKVSHFLATCTEIMNINKDKSIIET